MRTFYTMLCLSFGLFGYSQQDIFPTLDGQDLFEAVVEAYKPAFVLPSGNSRDTLYGVIYNHNDSLTCVYTGFTIYLDPTLDPSVAAYMNGGPNGLNLEHTYPQGFGAGSGNANADMHHLCPSRIDVNSIRGSHPFGDIPDNQTERWYYQDDYITSIPASNKDLYSEYKSGLFEPREDHKGNVARAMFYFYTMYRNEANAEDPNFFNSQRNTFCNWHLLDPVDDAEWSRTMKIATYQDDKPNPFILDCTLAARIYCPEILTDPCSAILDTEESPQLPDHFVAIHPNPANDQVNIKYQLQQNFQVSLRLVDPYGKNIRQLVQSRQVAGDYLVTVPTDDLPAGVWFVQLELQGNDGHLSDQQQLVIIH